MFFSIAQIVRVFKWTHKQVLQLTISQYHAYGKQADVFLADDQLKAFESAMFAEATPEYRKKLWSHYSKNADPNYEKNKKRKLLAELKYWEDKGFGKKKKKKKPKKEER